MAFRDGSGMCIIAKIFMCVQCTLRAADLELTFMSTVPAVLSKAFKMYYVDHQWC